MRRGMNSPNETATMRLIDPSADLGNYIRQADEYNSHPSIEVLTHLPSFERVNLMYGKAN